jgi:hypothetical protein
LEMSNGALTRVARDGDASFRKRLDRRMSAWLHIKSRIQE